MDTLYDIFGKFHISSLSRAILLMILGYLCARLGSEAAKRTVGKHLNRHQNILLRRFIFYLVLFIFFAAVIDELGFRISALLGATGILTIAIGIASQTSLSNIISGIFIIGEKPFEIGDTIKINELQGEVLSIDLLSIRIRTSDNTMIRIPNETLTKSAIINTSYFPIRRIDVPLTINDKNNLAEIKQVLLELVNKNMSCLDEPEPTVIIQSLGDASINIQFQVWTHNNLYAELKSQLQEDIHTLFAKKGFTIGTSTNPLSINIIPGN